MSFINPSVHLRITSDVPNRASTRILMLPALFLNSVLCSLYSGHSRRKCSTVSWPVPQLQSGLSARPKRCRYELRSQCPILSYITFVAVFQNSLLYSAGPYWLPFHRRMRFRRDGGAFKVRFIHCPWAVSFIYLIRECFSVCAICFVLSIASCWCGSEHQGAWVKGEMALSVPIVVMGNCCRMFSILVWYLTAAVLVRRLSLRNSWIGWFVANVCIRVRADSTFVWSRIQGGGRPDSISIATVGVVR